MTQINMTRDGLEAVAVFCRRTSDSQTLTTRRNMDDHMTMLEAAVLQSESWTFSEEEVVRVEAKPR
jgi:hypothetical protein